MTAPILFLAGEHDSRCPLRQILIYTDRLEARNHPHELYLFPTGHAPFQIDERVKQPGVVLDFLARNVPGIRRWTGIAGELAGDASLWRAQLAAHHDPIRSPRLRELLDGDLTDERVLEGNLRDLRRINRFSGGLALSRRAVDALIEGAKLPPDQPVTLVDVGTGGRGHPDRAHRGLAPQWPAADGSRDRQPCRGPRRGGA